MPRSLIAAGFVLAFGLTLTAQQPPKGPVYPPINPAVARLEQTITGLDGPGFAIAAGDEADVLVAGCERDTIQAWKKDVLLGIRTGSGTGSVLKGHDGAVIAMAWRGGPVLISAGSDKKLVFWNMIEGKIEKTVSCEAPLKALAMSADGKLLASAGEDMAVQLWDVAAAKPTAKLVDHKDWILSLAISPDGKQIASGDIQGAVRLWDVAGAKKLMELPAKPTPPPKEPPEPVAAQSLAFAPDGKSLALGGADGNIHLINLADGKTIRSMPGHASAVTALAFHPSGALLASSSKDRTVRLWNPASGQAFKVLEGHTAWVEGIAFTLQYTKLASVGADQTVRLWDLTETPKK